MQTWTITVTDTFLNELVTLPQHVSKKLTKAIKVLERDPNSANADAKKLKEYKDTYRVRIGDYRLIYTFGQGWVKLLTVRKRDERTYDLEIQNTKLPQALAQREILETQESKPKSLNRKIIEVKTVQNTNQERGLVTELPFKLTPTILEKWQISPEYWSDIISVPNCEALLELPLPDRILQRIIDNLYPRPIEEIAAQPEYVLQDVEDLDRFFEGDLNAFLLKLAPQQEKLLKFGQGGPVLVKGGPGTGKSTLALYRVQRLIEEGYKSILFTTYTNALINYSEQLLTQLLGCPSKQAGVEVATVDMIAYRYYIRKYNKPTCASTQECLSLLNTALENTQINSEYIFEQIERLGLQYLLEEILDVIETWGIDSLQAYLSHERRGRRTPIKVSMREAIWAIYQTWQALMEDNGLITWEQLRSKSLEITRGLSTFPYQAIIIDEAQDLSPTSLRFLLNLVPNFNGVYLTADASQSLYQRGFSWKQIHEDLQVTGRTILLKHNYRNTIQIAEACAAILQDSPAGDPECLQQTSSPQQSEQPLLLLLDDSEREIHYMKEFLLNAARKFRIPLHGGAVLCLSNHSGREYAQRLTNAGLKAKFVSGKEIDLKAPYIKVLTLHSAKGLEFPFVILTGLKEGQFPYIDKTVPDEEISGLLEAQLRLLYVGCSRAMRALMVCASSTYPSQFLQVLPDSCWQKQEYR